MRTDVNVWLGVGMVLALAEQLMAEYLWILSLLPLACGAVAGLVLLAYHVFRLPRPSEHYLRRWNVLGLVAGALVFVPVSSVGEVLLRQARFWWHLSEYERVVAAVDAAATVPTSLSYEVDPGPPKRVAFPWPGGILDNWCGVVHDPTGLVIQVNQQELGSPAWRAHPATRLFGGDMVGCRQMNKHYDLCCFT